jgi:hypothetical protein
MVGVNNNIVNYQWLNGTHGFMQNKTGSNAVATHSDMKRNISGKFPLAITLLYSTYSINKEMNKADGGYLVHRIERKISHLKCMDDFKLLGRCEDYLENKIQIVKAISIDVDMNSGLEKSARICLKKVGSKEKYIQSNSKYLRGGSMDYSE